MIFEAGCVGIAEENDVLTVGWADRDVDPTWYFLLQRGLVPDLDSDGLYLELCDQIRGAYGQVATCTLTRDSVTLRVDRQTGVTLQVNEELLIRFVCDDQTYVRLRDSLKRVFADTDCQLEQIHAF